MIGKRSFAERSKSYILGLLEDTQSQFYDISKKL